MLTSSHITLGMLASMLAAGNAVAVSREAQEFMNIQSKMAPDQCELQRLSSQAAAAQRAGDLGKRQELNMQMEPVVKRLQANQPRIQELAKYVQSPSPDYQAVVQQTTDLRAKCKF
jgi:chromosome condensin MukBEF ATPase and DNA-binding subunit MukB